MYGDDPSAKGTPLYAHLLDASGVALELWDTWVAPSVKSAVSKPFGGDTDLARNFLAVCAGLHDIGKASPAFQSKVTGLYALVPDEMRTSFTPTPRPRRGEDEDEGYREAFGEWLVSQAQEHHTRAGGAHLHMLYRNVYGNRNVAGDNGVAPRESALETLVSAVVGHHGSYADVSSTGTLPKHAVLSSMSRRLEAFGGEIWESARTDLMHMVLDALELPHDYLNTLFVYQMDAPSRAMTAALVVMCDWIASSESVIPLVARHDWGTIPVHLERGKEAVRKLNFPAQWTPPRHNTHSDVEVASLYQKRFGRNEETFTPTLLQRKVIEAAECGLRDKGAGLLLIEAPTGTGKTEAALVAAEILAKRHDRSGVIYTMPTRATADAAFTRVRNWLNATSREGVSLTLHHGMSAFNDEYATEIGAVKHRADATETFDMSVVTCEPECVDSAEAHRWFSTGGKRILSSMVVGTIDALLEAGLDRKHVSLKHLGLHSKVIVVDEVHSSDAYMLEYLCTVLAKAGAYGIPVIALTATATPSLRKRLHSAYIGLPESKVDILEPASFPTVTTSAHMVPEVREFPAARGVQDQKPPVNFSVNGSLNTHDDVAEEAIRLYRAGGAVCVVSNTVGRAQRVYDAVLTQVPASDATLNHSRFTAKDRRDKDTTLLARFGKLATRKPHIVVATQVVEQSLDVDFDVMLSDVAPIDYLIQRAGRVHRHDHPRPVGMETPHVTLCGADTAAHTPVFAEGVGIGAIYPRHLAISALAWVGEGCSFDPYADTRAVMNILDWTAADAERNLPTDWSDAWCASSVEYNRDVNIAVSRAAVARISPYPNNTKPLSNFPYPVSTSMNMPDRWKDVAVRNRIWSENVILLWQDGDAVRLMPEIVPARYSHLDLSVDFTEIENPSRHDWAFRHAATSQVALPGIALRRRVSTNGSPRKTTKLSLWEHISRNPRYLLLHKGAKSRWISEGTRYLALDRDVQSNGGAIYRTTVAGYVVTYTVETGLQVSLDSNAM